MYQHTDFLTNPKKYELFKTAIINNHFFTHNGEFDLTKGTVVGIKFRCIAPNKLYRRDEPVYSVILQNGLFYGDLYANALTNFVL